MTSDQLKLAGSADRLAAASRRQLAADVLRNSIGQAAEKITIYATRTSSS
jgi:hypothetical protein